MASIFHHSGVRVANLERAAQFYFDAFDAFWMHKPIEIGTEGAERVVGGPPGVNFKFAYIGFDDGALELFEFIGEVRPDWVVPARGTIPHFGLLVEDVHATVARVERAGGTQIWSEPGDWGESSVTFVADLDDNPIELLEVPVETIVELTVGQWPEAKV